MKDRFKSFTNNLGNSIQPIFSKTQEKLNAGIDNFSDIGSKTKESVKSGLSSSTEFLNEKFENISSNVEEKISDLTQNINLPSIDQFKPSNKPKPETGSTEEIEIVIGKLKKKDKIGSTGEILAPIGGAAAGVAAASTIASAAGATTILGSTTLGSALGGVFVASTPVGWVVGSAVAAGFLGYVIAKLIRSGANQDQIRKDLVKVFEARLHKLKANSVEGNSLDKVSSLLAELTSKQLISEQQAERTLILIETGKLSTEVALTRFKAILEKSQDPALAANKPE